jgi:esterase/lipase superfamily enzyme
MEIRYFKHYSRNLDRDMEFKVYGHCGRPVLFIPCEGGRFYDYEDFGMIDRWAQWIEEGRCCIYTMDSIDHETYLSKEKPSQRVWRHEQWYNYIIDELVPYIRFLSQERNGYDQGIMTFGCAMGAMHSANLFFRRPDLFNGVFALSGVYDSKMYFGDYMDDVLYRNTPTEYLRNLPEDHYYKRMYNNRRMLFVAGQGPWEEASLNSLRYLEYVLRGRGIHAQTEYWGNDVSHDWYWWHRMVEVYAPRFLY